MDKVFFKIRLFVKCVGYDIANWRMQRKISRAWQRLGAVQEELDRIKGEARTISNQ